MPKAAKGETMNKIFKVVYDKVKGNYVVTSEFGKAHKKTKGISVMKTAAMAMILPVMVTATTLPFEASAATADPVTYDTEVEEEHSQITLDGPVGVGTKIYNVAEGSVSKGSMEAVNGSQLYETNQAVGTINSTIINLNTSISSLKKTADDHTSRLVNIASDITNLKNVNDTGYTINVNGKTGVTLNSTNTKMSLNGSDTIEVSADKNNNITIKGITGSVGAGVTTLVTGDDVYQAIKTIPTDVTLNNKLDVDLGNLNEYGEKNLKKKVNEAFSLTNGTNTTVSKTTNDDGTVDYTINVKTDGTITENNSGIVSGGTVYSYLKDNMPKVDTNGLADINLSNISNDAKDKIKEVMKTDMGTKVNTDASNVNVTEWTEALGTTSVTENGVGFISSGTLFTALKDLETDVTDTLTEVTENFATVEADNIGKNLKVNNGNGLVAGNEQEIQRNLNSWGRALGTGTISATSEQLVTGKTVYNALSGYTLVDASNIDVSKWLAKLGIGTNTEGDTGLITGDTLSKALANYKPNTNGNTTTANTEVVKYTGSDTIAISDKNVISVKTEGEVKTGNTGIVTGGQVFEAINKATEGLASDSNIANKADKDLSNISDNGKNKIKEVMKDDLNKKADKTYVDESLKTKAEISYVNEKLNTKANTDGSNIDANKFSEKVAVGTVTEGDNRAVSGTAVNKAISEATKTLKEGVVDKDLSNISGKGTEKITKITQNSIKVIAGENTTVTEGTQDGTKTYAINVSNETIKNAVKEDLDKKADTTYVNEKLNTKINVDASNLTEENVTTWSEKLGIGKVTPNNKGLVTGETVYAAIVKVDANKGLVDSNDGEITIGKYDESTSVNFTNSNGENRILTGVKTDKEDMSSVANVGYVQETETNIYNNVNTALNNLYGKVNNEINKGVAGASALAALHPLEYDPNDKLNFAIGYGHYHNANAAAIGAFYYANANTMFSVGASLGNGSNAVNAGISFKFGKGSSYNGVSKAEMAAVLNKQGDEIAKLKKDNEELKEQMKKLLERMK